MVRGAIVLSLLAVAVGVWSKAVSPIEQEAKIIPGSYVVEFDDATVRAFWPGNPSNIFPSHP